jgi:CspA family cold shock protein
MKICPFTSATIETNTPPHPFVKVRRTTLESRRRALPHTDCATRPQGAQRLRRQQEPHGKRVSGATSAQSKENRGIATALKLQKGFGFIQHQDGSMAVFVHNSAVPAAGLNGLNDGQKVSYEVVKEHGKEAAANLKLG